MAFNDPVRSRKWVALVVILMCVAAVLLATLDG